jgi:hypothetical protein
MPGGATVTKIESPKKKRAGYLRNGKYMSLEMTRFKNAGRQFVMGFGYVCRWIGCWWGREEGRSW